jgi:hypothetical protein
MWEYWPLWIVSPHCWNEEGQKRGDVCTPDRNLIRESFGMSVLKEGAVVVIEE